MAKWSAKLARAVRVRDTKIVLATLSDARGFILALPADKQNYNAWQHATSLLLAAAEDAERICAANRRDRRRAVPGWVQVAA